MVRVTAFSELRLSDITYAIVAASVWTTIEQSVSIVCTCLTITRPFFGIFLRAPKQHSNGSSVHGAQTSAAAISLKEKKKSGEGDDSAVIPRARFAGRIVVDGKVKEAREGFGRMREAIGIGGGGLADVEAMGRQVMIGV